MTLFKSEPKNGEFVVTGRSHDGELIEFKFNAKDWYKRQKFVETNIDVLVNKAMEKPFGYNGYFTLGPDGMSYHEPLKVFK